MIDVAETLEAVADKLGPVLEFDSDGNPVPKNQKPTEPLPSE